MLVLELREHEQVSRLLSFSRHALGLGRTLPGLTLGGDIGLAAGGVLAEHIELFEKDGHLYLRAIGPTLLDGVPLNGPPSSGGPTTNRRNRKKGGKQGVGRRLAIGSVVGLGDSTVLVVVRFEPIVPPDFERNEFEAPFLRAIDADPSSVGERLVYADALEEGGWLIRAEYLRLQLRVLLGEAIEGDLEAKERYLKNLLPAWRWVQRVAEPTVARNCQAKLGRACPVAWGSEARTSVCAKCNRAVPHAAR
jgi:uncharacterized protein (TIGR02996 family)